MRFVQLRCELPAALSPRVTQLRAGGTHWVLRSGHAQPPRKVYMGSGKALLAAPGWAHLDSFTGSSEDWGSSRVEAAGAAQGARMVRWDAAAGLRFLPDASVSIVMLNCLLYRLSLPMVRRLLTEAARVLAPGGTLRIGENSEGYAWTGDPRPLEGADGSSLFDGFSGTVPGLAEEGASPSLLDCDESAQYIRERKSI